MRREWPSPLTVSILDGTFQDELGECRQHVSLVIKWFHWLYPSHWKTLLPRTVWRTSPLYSRYWYIFKKPLFKGRYMFGNHLFNLWQYKNCLLESYSSFWWYKTFHFEVMWLCKKMTVFRPQSLNLRRVTGNTFKMICIPVRDYFPWWTYSLLIFGHISKARPPFEIKFSDVTCVHWYKYCLKLCMV